MILNYTKFIENKNNLKLKDKVIIDVNILLKEIEHHKKLLKKVNTPTNMIKSMLENNYKIYDYALNKKEAIITWMDNSDGESSMVNLKFEDGFECSSSKKSLIKK